MSDTIETIRDYSVGNARLVVRAVHDPDPDYSYLGEFSAWRNVPYDAYVYDMREHLMGEPTRIINGEYRRIWRDARGRIAAAPDTDDSYAREYRYILPAMANYHGLPSADVARYCRQDAEHLDAYARDQWRYIGIVATVSVAGREIGSGSVWDIEADWRYDARKNDPDDLRNVVREAIDEAQAYRRTLAKSA